MTDGHGAVGRSDAGSDRPTAELLVVARSGTPEERAVLASTLGLPRQVVDALARDEDEHVASSLAWNPETPSDVIDDLADRRPELRDWIASQLNAPARLKNLLRVGEHSGRSIELYLDDVGASSNQRRRLLAEHNRTPAREGRELGEAWQEISSMGAR